MCYSILYVPEVPETLFAKFSFSQPVDFNLREFSAAVPVKDLE